MTTPIPNCPQGETEFKDRAYTPEQEAARYATDLRHLIYMDAQFGMCGETDLKLPEMQALEARGWIAEGEENAEYNITEEGERIIAATLRQQGSGSSLFTGTLYGVPVGLHGTKESIEAVDRLVAEHEARQQAEQAGGVVSDEMVNKAFGAFLRGLKGDGDSLKGIRAALEAITPLLREPAGQGGRVDEGMTSEEKCRAIQENRDYWCGVAEEYRQKLFDAEAALAQNAQTQHPDDAAVDRFAAALKAKLAEARAKGRGGWQDKDDCPQQRLSDMLRAHVEKGDPRDVANFCMFLHQRGESILPAQNAQGEAIDPAANWPEDAVHENGNYECICASCGRHFIGYKRRVTCRLCHIHYAWPAACKWPAKEFTVRDESGEHDPCWLVMPDNAMLAFVQHATNGVDQARAQFVADACNAYLHAERARVPQEWRSLIANLAAVIRVQNGNRHDDTNRLLDHADRLLAASSQPEGAMEVES